MGSAYAIEAWNDFALMIGGASAALAGLLIVAMSINLDQILRFASLPSRAAAALVTMLSPLFVSVFLLVPGQADAALGIELAGLGVVLGWMLLGRLARYRAEETEQPFEVWLLGTGVPMIVLSAGIVLAGFGTWSGTIGGLLWLVPAVLAAIVGGTAQAWVLLVEIRR